MNPEKFLNSLVNYEKVPGYNYDLEAYKEFLEKLDAPHKKLKNVILIAGTKGKGSTAAIINSCLIANGYKVGLYTSPHLKKINERITVNSRQITDKELEKYIRIIKPYINTTTRIGARTFFEVLTTIAFLHFVKQNLDFTILEVGLGGRLDATNVFDSHISVITRVGYDHTNLLGNKLSQIAYEKAGIIPTPHPSLSHKGRGFIIQKCSGAIYGTKKLCSRRLPWTGTGQPARVTQPKGCDYIYKEGKSGIEIATPLDRLPSNSLGTGGARNDKTVITIHQRPSVEKVLQKIACERNNKIIFADDLHKIEIKTMTLAGTDVQITGPLGKFDAFLSLVGRRQIENLQLALTVLHKLKLMGFHIKTRWIKKGIARTKLPGRFEVISYKPLIIYDVAHNEDSFKALDENIARLTSGSASLVPRLNRGIRTIGSARLCLVERGKPCPTNPPQSPFTKGGNNPPIPPLLKGGKGGFYLIFSCNKDKDINYAIKNLFPRAKEVLLVKADNPRAMELIEICKKAKKYQKKLLIIGSVKKAIEYLKTKVDNNSAIIITGSFYLYNEL